MVSPIIEGLGFECWGLEFISQGKHSILRVFIESQSGKSKPDSESGAESGAEQSESGVELKDCELVSRQISGVLDVEDPIAGDYTLEVSSPGMDRPLYHLAHYERFSGAHIALKLRLPYEGRRKFTGILKGIEGNDIVLQVEQEEFLFPLEAIEKANVIPQFD